MPVHCADCDSTFLLTPDGMTQGAACPDCGGKRLERDQPSPTHSDGDLRNMVDPGTGLDQGGNPLQEGIWATTDGGWQPHTRRDESFASVRTAMDFGFGDGGFDFTDKNPTHKFIVDQAGKVYSGPAEGTHEQIADQHRLIDQGYPKGMSLGELNDDGSTDWYSHETPHSAQALESMLYGHFGRPVQIDPNLKPTTNEERWGIDPMSLRGPGGPPRELERLYGPASPRSWGVPRDNEGLVRGGSVLDDLIPQDPYMPWWVEASEKVADVPVEPQAPVNTRVHTATVTPGPHGIHNGTVKWLQFLDAAVDGLPAREHGMRIAEMYGIPSSPKWGQPVEVAVNHPDHLDGAIDTIATSAHGNKPSPVLKNAAIAMSQGAIPPPPGINPASLKFSNSKLAFLPLLAPLIAGGAEALGGASVAGVMGGLMRGALMGTGSHMVQGLLGGGGGNSGTQDAAGQMPSGPRGVEQLSSVHEADLETPSSNPGYHDSPDGDTKQFADQSTSTAPQNPNIDGEAGGAADGEDEAGGGVGPQFSEHALERANLLLPLIMHYHHSEESGANDALLRELHQQLDQEVPGYLDQADDQGVQQLIQKMREPQAIAASTKQSIMDPYAQPQQGFQDPWGDHNDVNPSQAQFAPGQGGGHCPYCGGTTTADGSCPQCGAKVNPQGGAMPPGGQPQIGTPQTSVAPPGMGMQPPGIQNQWAAKTAADHQGPATDEQKAAVADYLNQTGRHEEIPTMLREPWNYAKELAEIANKVNTVPNIDPNEQAPPAPPQMGPAPNGGLPPGMPNPADPSMMPQSSVKHSSPHPGAPRCPKCKSATTGVFHNGMGDMSGECHACGNIWGVDAELSREARTALDGNPMAVPAADQDTQYDSDNDQDSSQTWQDDSGAPLVPGQEYEMHNPQYSIPDIVKVEQIKPDAIVVNMVGEYNNTDQQSPDDAGSISYRHEIPKEEVALEKITFTPHTGDDSGAGDQSLQEYQNQGQAPVNTEPVEQTAIDPRHTHVEAATEEAPDRDDACPKCTSQHITSQMSSPTSSFHDCFRCGHGWETREEDYMDQNTADRSWIMSSSGPGGDDFFSEYERTKAMRESGGSGTRNLADIARKDPRLQEIHDRLESNKTAGRKFSPSEQRQFIDEQGVARNSDKLDLANTHYEDNHRYVGEKANGANVGDEYLFLGL